MCNQMCLPYTALANSISSNYPVLVLHCKVPANNERFAGGCYKALLLSPLFSGTLWWQLKHDGSDVVHMEGHDTGQCNRTGAFVQPGQEDSCAFSHPLFSAEVGCCLQQRDFKLMPIKIGIFFFFFPPHVIISLLFWWSKLATCFKKICLNINLWSQELSDH